MNPTAPKALLIGVPVMLGLNGLVACSPDPEQPGTIYDSSRQRQLERGSVFGGDGGIQLLGPSRKDGDGEGGGIGVNSFLWRASLDTLGFMPMASADPFGGVILTDWYSPPETPQERFKVNVYILGRQLRADGVRASVFRQVVDGNGGWRDAAVDNETARKLEDSILTRARQLRIASGEG